MANFEAPRFESDENDLDLRNENEVFRDHERLADDVLSDAALKSEWESLADEEDGVLYIKLPVYRYDTSYNPFLGMGPRTIRLYSISRHLDVTFLHRFMHGDILVRGLRSGDYVPLHQRKKFIKHIKETGGLPVIQTGETGYDFEALRFAPYVASDTTMPVFEKYHKSDEHSGDRPHYPVDIWLVYDINAYEQVSVEMDNKAARYKIRQDYDLQSSLLALAVIN